MEEEKNIPVRDSTISPPPPGLAASLSGRFSPRFHSFRSSAHTAVAPASGLDGQLSPTNNGWRPQLPHRDSKNHHDSSRPPLLRPTSVIPPKEANIDFPQDKLLEDTDKLIDFRRMVGIDSAPTYTLSSGYHRPAENVGIYEHVVQHEVSCMAKYKQFSILINSSLGLQIVVAAALTALGAGDGPRAAVTVFGAVNTVRDYSILLTSPRPSMPLIPKHICS